jgi:NADH:ubiquinone reductase (H+-translocating)
MSPPPLVSASGARPHVVIVGAGFGGLTCAQRLAKAPVDITLIDRNNHHIFQPLLYQVATAALAPNDIAWPIRSILRRQRNVTTLMDEVVAVDRARRVVKTTHGETPYDFLVVATGATHAYFGREEWSGLAPGLKRIEDATAIRRRLLSAFEAAEASTDEAERRRLLTFIIIGGGPTGVEMAGAIAELGRTTLAGDFRRIDPRSARTILIEAGPRVLSTYPESLSAYARRALERLGVEVRTGEPVTDVDLDGVMTAKGRIPASTIIWGAGIRASPAAGWLGIERDRAGRAVVNPDLTIPGDPNVFVLGDTASVMDETGAPIPGIAPAAKQMGRHVARQILARAEGRTLSEPFRYKHSGDLATIGRNAAAVKLDSMRLTGFPGWLFWSAAHIYFLIGARNRIAVAFNWFWDYVTLQRGVRLITAACDPVPASTPARTPTDANLTSR